MQTHKLTRQQIADLLSVSIRTVDSWLYGTKDGRKIPKRMLELLLLKLKDKQ